MSEPSEMVGRAGRAIYDAPNGIDGDQIADMLLDDDRISGECAEDCRAQIMAVCQRAASAALSTLDPPTQEMIAAGLSVYLRADMRFQSGDDIVAEIWRAMHAAMLGETSE